VHLFFTEKNRAHDGSSAQKSSAFYLRIFNPKIQFWPIFNRKIRYSSNPSISISPAILFLQSREKLTSELPIKIYRRFPAKITINAKYHFVIVLLKMSKIANNCLQQSNFYSMSV